MSKHSAVEEDPGELDYGYILPPDTNLWLRVLCYLFVYGFAALGLWCLYLRIFV